MYTTKLFAWIFLAYRTAEGKPWVLPVVRKAEKALVEDETLNKEYLPVLGLEAFSSAATKMLLGDNSPAIKDNRVRNQQYYEILYLILIRICLRLFNFVYKH